MQQKRVLLILNKIDALVTVPPHELNKFLCIQELERIMGSRLTVLRTSAASAVGIEEVLQHFAKVCKQVKF